MLLTSFLIAVALVHGLSLVATATSVKHGNGDYQVDQAKLLRSVIPDLVLLGWALLILTETQLK